MTLITDLIKQQQEEVKGVLSTKTGMVTGDFFETVDTLIIQTVEHTVEAVVGMCEKQPVPPYPHEGAHGDAISQAAQRGYQDALTDLVTTLRAALSKGELPANDETV